MSPFPLYALPSTLIPPFSLQHEPNSHFIALRSLWLHMNIKQISLKSAWSMPSHLLWSLKCSSPSPSHNNTDGKTLELLNLLLYPCVSIQVLLQSAGQERVWFGTCEQYTHLCHRIRCVSCQLLDASFTPLSLARFFLLYLRHPVGRQHATKMSRWHSWHWNTRYLNIKPSLQ